MNRKMFVVFAVALIVAQAVARAEWKPVPGNLLTRWAKDVNPEKPWPEYPRPQLVRDEWTNLNGLWDYAIVDLDAPTPNKFDGQILVPFPIESALSGVKKPLTAKDRLWYRRTFNAPTLGGGKKLLLHFGAVDWEAKIFVNGKPVGEHKGGYDAFTCDITDAVKPGAANELVVAVFDATGGMQPKGKQHLPAIKNPGGIMYTPSSGIWQTVWLEAVPANHIQSLHIVPDVDNSRVLVTVNATDASRVAKITLLDAGKRRTVVEGKVGEPIEVKIPQPKLWSPDSPFLYDLKIVVGTDEVSSYFGLRKIALAKDDKGILRPMLNGQFVFQSGPLDQGFWPDGIYLAPTDEALRYDIEVTRKLGMNMARKHVKVEPDRWYYWADKLGLLVWQDMPSGRAGKGGGRDKKTGETHDGVRNSDEDNAQFEAELKAMITQHWNHPSIILWVVFNEGWGQYETPRLTKFTKDLDPSRLVNNASGWTDFKVGDVNDMHNYPGPGCPKLEDNRAAVLGEFGGLGLAITNHTWVEKSWGYRGMANQAGLTKKYCELWQKVWKLKDEGLCAAVYTQTTDCETECNGLLTYDREIIKVDLQKAADAASGKFPPPPIVKIIVPTAEAAAVNWKFTTQQPAAGWETLGFDATAWKESPAGFGGGRVPNVEPRTQWKTDDIWLRREIELPAAKLTEPVFHVYHDEDVEIFVNGVLAATAPGYTTDYEDLALTPEGIAALKPGKNLLAIHVHQTIGGQFIDAGLNDLVPAN